MKKTLILLMTLTLLTQADFTRSVELVTDSRTGLVWQDDVEAKTTKMLWIDAIGYCEALGLKGHTDWRLPNFNELYSITLQARNRSDNMYRIFQNVSSDIYWSSTTVARETGDKAWAIDFDGKVAARYKDTERYVRCVRDLAN